MKDIKPEILEILELSDNYAEAREDRRKGVRGSQEFFTPYKMVSHMCDKISKKKWEDPDSEWLEPCFGNGAFIVEIIRRRIQNYNIPWRKTLETLWGTELMKDNVKETHDRVIKLLKAMDVPRFDEKKAREIMKNNLVQTDFFEWSFEYWCPIKDIPSEELQKSSNTVKEAVEQYYKKQKIESVELF